jgi:hypothetical protein
MNQRLLAVTTALIAMTATAAAGFADAGRIADATAGPSQYGEWIADTERPSGGYRLR